MIQNKKLNDILKKGKNISSKYACVKSGDYNSNEFSKYLDFEENTIYCYDKLNTFNSLLSIGKKLIESVQIPSENEMFNISKNISISEKEKIFNNTINIKNKTFIDKYEYLCSALLNNQNFLTINFNEEIFSNMPRFDLFLDFKNNYDSFALCCVLIYSFTELFELFQSNSRFLDSTQTMKNMHNNSKQILQKYLPILHIKYEDGVSLSTIKTLAINLLNNITLNHHSYFKLGFLPIYFEQNKSLALIDMYDSIYGIAWHEMIYSYLNGKIRKCNKCGIYFDLEGSSRKFCNAHRNQSEFNAIEKRDKTFSNNYKEIKSLLENTDVSTLKDKMSSNVYNEIIELAKYTTLNRLKQYLSQDKIKPFKSKSKFLEYYISVLKKSID